MPEFRPRRVAPRGRQSPDTVGPRSLIFCQGLPGGSHAHMIFSGHSTLTRCIMLHRPSGDDVLGQGQPESPALDAGPLCVRTRPVADFVCFAVGQSLHRPPFHAPEQDCLLWLA